MRICWFCSASIAQKFDESYLSSFAEVISSRGYELRTGTFFLELFVVNVGEELRFLEYVRSQPGVISASLNYLGVELNSASVYELDHPELEHQPGLPLAKDFNCFLRSGLQKGEIRELTYKDLVNELRRDSPENVIAAIDVRTDHCKKIMEAIVEGYDEDDPGPTIIGLTSNVDRSELTDLDGFCDRLLVLAQLISHDCQNSTRVVAINMSVDFSLMIRGYQSLEEADPSVVESPDTIISNPYFEDVLSETVVNLTTDSKSLTEEEKQELPRSPALFAAAGNRLIAGAARVRLGYPAVRPEVMAVTFVKSAPAYEEVEPVDSVDVPATSGLKPCFAIDINEVSVTFSNGSSFASAWLAGYYANLAREVEIAQLGPLSKVAYVMRNADRRLAPSGNGRLPCFVSVVRPWAVADRSVGEADELVETLFLKFHTDFYVYGSTATVAEWLRLKQRRFEDIDSVLHKDLGDIDLLYAGDLPHPRAEDVTEFVRDWFRKRLGHAWVIDRKRPIQLHPYIESVSLGDRLRSVTPAIKLCVTHGGLIDTWGGLSDLEKGEIRFFPQTSIQHWKRNKLYRTGADCLALNILHWISSLALLQLLSLSFKDSPPKAAAVNVKQVLEILQRVADSGDKIILFGIEKGDLRERIDRRFDRVETLLASCSRRGEADPELDQIVTQLRQIYVSLPSVQAGRTFWLR